MSGKGLRIGTRKSTMALAQTEEIARLLGAAMPDLRDIKGQESAKRALKRAVEWPLTRGADFARLADECARMVSLGADWLHVDVMARGATPPTGRRPPPPPRLLSPPAGRRRWPAAPRSMPCRRPMP